MISDFDYYSTYYINGKYVMHRTLKKGETRLITPEEAQQWADEYYVK